MVCQIWPFLRPINKEHEDDQVEFGHPLGDVEFSWLTIDHPKKIAQLSSVQNPLSRQYTVWSILIPGSWMIIIQNNPK